MVSMFFGQIRVATVALVLALGIKFVLLIKIHFTVALTITLVKEPIFLHLRWIFRSNLCEFAAAINI